MRIKMPSPRRVAALQDHRRKAAGLVILLEVEVGKQGQDALATYPDIAVELQPEPR
jgi:hypothetical protein